MFTISIPFVYLQSDKQSKTPEKMSKIQCFNPFNGTKTGSLVKTATGYKMIYGDAEVDTIKTDRTYVAALYNGSTRLCMFGRPELIGKGDSNLWLSLINHGKHEIKRSRSNEVYLRTINQQDQTLNLKVTRRGVVIDEKTTKAPDFSQFILFVLEN
jgi:hypothetical protein